MSPIVVPTSKAFDWRKWESGILPDLEQHSVAKLCVLRDYVEEYIGILCANSFGVETFRVTLVDGFSGGGVYADGKQVSPFVLLQAVESAEAKLNLAGRSKPIKVDCECHFIDSNKAAFDCLQHQFQSSRYKERIGKSVFLHRGSFDDHYSRIVDRLKGRHSRGGGRVIFFLDQCGYAKILPSTIRTISQQLLHAEFIVNFAIEWLVDFIADDGDFRKRFAGLGLDGYTSADAILKAKQEGSVHWKYLVESQIGPAFRRAAGIPFFSPFYIEPADGHRGYWLLHLAPHERARSAMIDVYWGNANSHKHFGHTGLNMLAYKTEVDQTGYLNGISFDDLTRSVVKSNLLQDFARVIRESHVDGVTFEDFAKKYTNQTMANRALMREVMGELAIKSELTITGPKGGKKRNGAVADADVISPCNQLWLPSFCARR